MDARIDAIIEAAGGPDSEWKQTAREVLKLLDAGTDGRRYEICTATREELIDALYTLREWFGTETAGADQAICSKDFTTRKRAIERIKGAAYRQARDERIEEANRVLGTRSFFRRLAKGPRDL